MHVPRVLVYVVHKYTLPPIADSWYVPNGTTHYPELSSMLVISFIIHVTFAMWESQDVCVLTLCLNSSRIEDICYQHF